MDRFERLRYQSPERRRLLLDEIIRVELLAAEARRRGLHRDPETSERIRQVLRDELLRQVRAEVAGPESIPEAEVRAYYDANRGEFEEPERRRVAAIVLHSRAEAEPVLEKARAASPTGWGELVQAHSTGSPESPGGAQPLELAGDRGIVSLGRRGDNPRVPEAVRQGVFEIKEVGGVHADVVEADGKFYVVRLIGRSDARTRSFADAQRTIRVTLVQRRIREAEAKLEAELRQKYPVKVDDAALSKITVPSVEQRDAGDGDTDAAP
jgi:peptidyl-prolyl cis-trans isomerase C